MLCDLIPKIAGMTQTVKEAKFKPRPSGAGVEKCIRAQVYEALGVPAQPFPGRTMLVFDDGNWHEELTAQWISKSTFNLHSQQMAIDLPFVSDFLPGFHCHVCKKDIAKNNLHGHIDGVITDMTGQDYLLEHKAINCYTFNGYESDSLKPYDYISQMICYMKGLAAITGKMPPGILLIKNKNTAQYIEYIIEYDDQTDIAKARLSMYDGTVAKEVCEFFCGDVWAKISERFIAVETYASHKTVPARQYDRSDWHCDYCGWGDFCYKDYAEEVDNRKGEVKIEDKELLAKVEKIYVAQEAAKKYKKVLDEYKPELTLRLANQNAKTGKAGEYVASLRSKKNSSIDKDKIPPQILAEATTKSVSEYVQITKIKGEVSNGK